MGMEWTTREITPSLNAPLSYTEDVTFTATITMT